MSRRRRSRGTSRRRFLLYAGGAGAALIGAATASSQTGAFSAVDADRGVRISSTDDANALLGIAGYADAGTVPTFTNNTESPVDITLDSNEAVEFDVGDTGIWERVPVEFELGPGASVDVALRDGGNAGNNSDIDIIATSPDGIAVEATRNFKIPAASAVKEIEPSVTSAGNSGKYRFKLKNGGGATVTLTEIGIVRTSNGNATKVGGENPDDIFTNFDSNTSLVSSVITIGESRVSLSPNVTLDPGVDNAIEFEFDRFRDDSNNNAGMKDDDVRIEVAFSDGSSTTLDLCVNDTCSFD